MFVSKTLYLLLIVVLKPFRPDSKIFDWDVKNQTKQANVAKYSDHISANVILKKFFFIFKRIEI